MVIDNTALIRSLLEFPPKSSDGCLRDNTYHGVYINESGMVLFAYVDHVEISVIPVCSI